MKSALDLFRVLYEPTAVFEGAQEKPPILGPFLLLCVLMIVVGAIGLPFQKIGMRLAFEARAAASPGGAPTGTDPSQFVAIGLIFVPIGLAIVVGLYSAVLWVLVSLFGEDAKFSKLASVAVLSTATAVLQQAITVAVLTLRGAENVASMQDLKVALGLNLLTPEAGGFLYGFLGAVNPFAIWSLVITAIGLGVTHKMAKGGAYGVATTAFLLGAVIQALLGSLGGMGS